MLARWTGIPVARMLEGEREKLLRMEQELHSRRSGQNEAVGNRTAIRQLAVQGCPIEPSDWFLPVPWADGGR